MKRIEFLRAMAAARNAFAKELESHGLHMTSFDPANPYNVKVYTLDRHGLRDEFVGEITFKNKCYIEH